MAKHILRDNNRISLKRGRLFQYNPPKKEIYFEAAIVSVSLFPALFLCPESVNGNRWLCVQVEPGHYTRDHIVNPVQFEIAGLNTRFERWLDGLYNRFVAWKAAR